MLGLFGRRAIDLVVLFLAVYAFAFVPLGKRTGLEHLHAVLHTRAARDAGHELTEAALHLKSRLLGEDELAPSRGTPVVPKLPRHSSPANLMIAPRDVRDVRDVPDASL